MGKLRLRQYHSVKTSLKTNFVFKIILPLGICTFIAFYFLTRLNLLNPKQAHAAILGDYQSLASGNWGTAGTWQRYNGTAWVDNVLINRGTITEINNDYLTIVRSSDGRPFSELSKMKGCGNSSSIHKYYFTDLNPNEGNSYYRLKQTDFNGKSEVFSPMAVKARSKPKAANNISVYPNPYKDSFTAQFELEEHADLELQMMNYGGIILCSYKLQLIPASFRSSIYLLKITDSAISTIATSIAICRRG